MRMMYFYTKDKNTFKEIFEKRYSEKAVIMATDEAVRKRLFGSNSHIASKYRERIGDIVMIAKNDHNFIYKYSDKDVHLKGAHGGLSFYEMMVPVVIIK